MFKTVGKIDSAIENYVYFYYLSLFALFSVLFIPEYENIMYQANHP